jgi:hypothetical protein
MYQARQKLEVERNYDAFVRTLGAILPQHRGQYALMRHGKIVAYFDRPGAANVVGCKRFKDGLFSIQEVTDEPIDLGFWSNVAAH